MKKLLLIPICLLIFFFLFRFTGFFVKKEVKIIREPVAAGKFYPEGKEVLEDLIRNYLSKAEYVNFGKLRGLVVPHAGYIFSGIVAAKGFKQIPKDIKTVIVIGPSHHFYFKGASLPSYTHFKTPLGEVKISKKVDSLRKNKIFVNVSDKLEHSIEVEIPFLQVLLGNDFELIPIMTGNVDPEKLADVLLPLIDKETLVIASSDLSHYYPYEIAYKIDKNCLEAIPSLNFSKMRYCEACGKIPILTLMHLAKKLGWYGYLLDYRTSGDTAGNKQSVVGYASIGFFEGINPKEQKILLKIARETLEFYLKNKTLPIIREEFLPERLIEKKGCFVTLYKKGKLRGCIGTLLPLEPLYRCVIRNSINAALHDIRFKPVSFNELKDIKIEISVLTEAKEVKFKNWKELLEKITRKDGIILIKEGRSATYLPQVWEQLPEKELFLSNLCIKAGLLPDCWKEEGVRIKKYQAQVFKE